jgi:hypothetical protein
MRDSHRWAMKPILGTLVTLVTAGSGCGGGSVSIIICGNDDANYTFDTVSLAGPATIANGGSGAFTATWTATVHAAGGGVCPIGDLIDDDGALRFEDDHLDSFTPVLGTTVTPGQRTGTATFSLQCRDGEVVGASGGSSEGSEPAFFLPVDEAEVVAVITRKDGSAAVQSNTIDVSCS